MMMSSGALCRAVLMCGVAAAGLVGGAAQAEPWANCVPSGSTELSQCTSGGVIADGGAGISGLTIDGLSGTFSTNYVIFGTKSDLTTEDGPFYQKLEILKTHVTRPGAAAVSMQSFLADRNANLILGNSDEVIIQGGGITGAVSVENFISGKIEINNIEFLAMVTLSK